VYDQHVKAIQQEIGSIHDRLDHLQIAEEVILLVIWIYLIQCAEH